MINEDKLKHYAINFLTSEIAAMNKTLSTVKTDGEKKLLAGLKRDYEYDLSELRREE